MVVSKRGLSRRSIAISVVMFTLLAAVVVSAQQVNKTDWVNGLSRSVAELVCEDSEFRRCFDVPMTECKREVQKRVNDCAVELDDQIPPVIKTAQEGEEIAELVGTCFTKKFDAFVKDRRRDLPNCAAPN